jgi:hypothetical protein
MGTHPGEQGACALVGEQRPRQESTRLERSQSESCDQKWAPGNSQRTKHLSGQFEPSASKRFEKFSVRFRIAPELNGGLAYVASDHNRRPIIEGMRKFGWSIDPAKAEVM